MIAALRRIFTASITPTAPQPVLPDVVAVRPHVRKKPVNAKREALHEQLRAELGRGPA